jgi:hypothetical protein
MEMVRNRRKQYEDQRRGTSDRDRLDDNRDRPHKGHGSIIDRLKNEGLRDA